MKRLLALANLACHFVLHVVRGFGGWLGAAPRRDGRTFHAQFAAEGIFALTPEDAAALPAHERCIHCGLCDQGPGVPDDRALGAWALAVGPARLLPAWPLAAADVERVGPPRAGAAFCPLGVPLEDVRARMTRPRP